MSRGRKLSEKEKGKIDLLKSGKLSNRAIAKKMKRSPTVVDNYVKLKDKYGLKRLHGRKSNIAGVLKKRLIHLASHEMMSASKIKHELALPQSTRTIQRVLKNCPTLVYRKFKKRPHLTAAHKSAREEFASKSISELV
jgi:IS30 family transposase